MKRLFIDIETSPNVVLSWRVGYKINIDSENILKERAVICIGYKWEDEAEPHVLVWDRNQDDGTMLRRVAAQLSKADEVIAHNGDSFDIPWIRSRMLFHGLTNLPELKTVDTLQWARRKFYFNSNRLDYLARYLGIGCKIKTEFKLWKDVVLNRSPKALDQMARYCAQDVALLEKVWRKLSPMVAPKTHVGVQLGGEAWSCARCGSERVKKNATKVTALGVVKAQMQCKDCGGNYSISQAAHAKYKEDKER